MRSCSHQAGRRHTAAALLKGVDPELAAYVTVRVTLGDASLQRSLHGTAVKVADALETELIADRFETANGALYRAVIRNAEARGLAPARQGVAVTMANRQFGVVEKPWTQKQRVLVGVKLVELAVESLGIIEARLVREGRTTNVHRLRFTEETEAWVAKYNHAAALYAASLAADRGPAQALGGRFRGGAYYAPIVGTRNLSLVTKPFPGQLEALAEAERNALRSAASRAEATRIGEKASEGLAPQRRVKAAVVGAAVQHGWVLSLA